MDLFAWFLFAHVMGAIIAFGPSFSMPIIGAMGGKEREHGNFAIRLSERLAKVQIWPLALLQGVTGVALIITGNVDLFARSWLLVAIVLYIIAISYSFFVQQPTVRKLVEMTSGGPPPGATAAGGPPVGGPPAGGQPAGGPPPQVMALVMKTRRGGMFMAALIVAIVFLMVVKPF